VRCRKASHCGAEMSLACISPCKTVSCDDVVFGGRVLPQSIILGDQHSLHGPGSRPKLPAGGCSRLGEAFSARSGPSDLVIAGHCSKHSAIRKATGDRQWATGVVNGTKTGTGAAPRATSVFSRDPKKGSADAPPPRPPSPHHSRGPVASPARPGGPDFFCEPYVKYVLHVPGPMGRMLPGITGRGPGGPAALAEKVNVR